MSKESTSGGGFTLLTIAFIVLKLCKVIDWSWWWVMAPAWLPAGMGLICLVCYAIYLLITSAKRKRDFEAKIKHPDFGKSRWQLRIEEMERENLKRKI